MNTAQERGLREGVAIEIGVFEKARPLVSPEIDLVWAFSGPGTAFEPWSAGDPEWMAWRDLERIMRAVVLVCKITASRLKIPVTLVGREQVELEGPILLYNGVEDKSENGDFVTWTLYPRFPIPESKIMVVREARDEEGKIWSIENTRDQVISVQGNPMWDSVREVALVSHAAHLPRILRYLDLIRPIPGNVKIRCFPVPNHDSLAQDTINETEAIIRYLNTGHLSAHPYPANLGLT